MTSEPLQKHPESPRRIHWTGVLGRVKKQSEARDSKEGGAA